MWRHLLWWAVVATAFALNDGEDAVSQDRVRQTSGRILLNVAPHYDKLPGLCFNEEADLVAVKTMERCRDICNTRRTNCKSYSWNTKSLECRVTQLDMKFDPDQELFIHKETGGYYGVSGLSYFHEHQGEWLRAAVHSSVACEQLCEKAKSCKAYKFNKVKSQCDLTGKKIIFGPDWNYYSKSQESEPESMGDEMGDEARAVINAKEEAAKLEAQIESERQALKAARAEVKKEKAVAEAELERQAANSHSIAILRDQLEQAKDAARDEIGEALKEKNLKVSQEEMKAKTAQEAAQFNKTQALHKEQSDAEIMQTQAEAKQKETEMAMRVKKIEQEAVQKREKKSFTDAQKAATRAATHEADKAALEAQRLEKLKAGLKIKEGDEAKELKRKKASEVEELTEDKKDVAEHLKIVQSEIQQAAQRAADTVAARMQNHAFQKVSNLTAAERNTAATAAFKKAEMLEEGKKSDKTINKLKLKVKALRQKIVELQKDLASHQAATAALIVELNKPGTPIPVDNSVSEKQKALLESIQKALFAAKEEEAKATRDAEYAMHLEQQRAAKAKAVVDAAVDAQQEKLKAIAAKQEKASLRRINQLRGKYAKAMEKARQVAQEGLEMVKQAGKEAGHMSDNAGYNYLEDAKKEYRTMVTKAIKEAEDVKKRAEKLSGYTPGIQTSMEEPTEVTELHMLRNGTNGTLFSSNDTTVEFSSNDTTVDLLF